MYGNVMDSLEDQIQNQLYCSLIAMNTPHFDYEGCLFSKDHMRRIDPGDDMTAEGSGRVSTYLKHKFIHCYTLECNYNTGRVGNEIAKCDIMPCENRPLISVPFTSSPEKYTPQTFADVGQACMIAMLDLRGHNEFSRIPLSKFKSLDRIRMTILSEVRQKPEYKGQTLRKKHGTKNRSTVSEPEVVQWRSRAVEYQAGTSNCDDQPATTKSTPRPPQTENISAYKGARSGNNLKHSKELVPLSHSFKVSAQMPSVEQNRPTRNPGEHSILKSRILGAVACQILLDTIPDQSISQTPPLKGNTISKHNRNLISRVPVRTQSSNGLIINSSAQSNHSS